MPELQHERAELFTKIHQLRQKVGKLGKDGKNKYQGFQYQSAEQVFTAIRVAMDELGLVLMTGEAQPATATDGFWVFSYQFTWVDVETGAIWTDQSSMTIPQYAKGNAGEYKDDKATGKAGTYALRYYLKRVLLITDKDDAEHDLDTVNSQSTYSSPQTQQRPAKVSIEVAEVEVKETKAGKKYIVAAKGNTRTSGWSAQLFAEAGIDVSSWGAVGTKQLGATYVISSELDSKGYYSVTGVRSGIARS